MQERKFVFTVAGTRVTIIIGGTHVLPVFSIDDDPTEPIETSLAVVTYPAFVPSETTDGGAPYDASFTIVSGTYTYVVVGETVSVVPTIEYDWYLDGVFQSTGETFPAGDNTRIGKTLSVTVRATDPGTGEVLSFPAETPIEFTDIDAEIPPSDPDAPTGAQLGFEDSVYVDSNGDPVTVWNPDALTRWKPRPVIDMGYSIVEAQWTTSGAATAEAIPANHVETLTILESVGTRYTLTTNVLNAASVGYETFYNQRDLIDTSRATQFRVRIRTVAGGVWSAWSDQRTLSTPPPAELPASVNFNVAAGTVDGRITVSAISGPAHWGDDSAGVVQWFHPVDGWATVPASPSFTVTLPESQFGRTIDIKLRAYGGTGAAGAETTKTVTVPGETATVTADWPPFMILSKAAKDNPTQYIYPGGGFHRQYFHGGKASRKNTAHVAMVMDVASLWIMPDATAQNPQMFMPGLRNVGVRNGVSVEWDPTTEGRLLLASTDGGSGGGPGLYLSEDFGHSAVQVLNAPMPGGAYGIYQGRYRLWRNLVCWDRFNTNRVLFIASANVSGAGASNTGKVFRSGNRGVSGSWSQVSTAPNGWGICYYLYQDAAGNWIACAQNGLYKSTDNGTNWTRIPNVASAPGKFAWPGGNYTGLALSETNPNHAYVVSFGNGVYRTTDGFQTYDRRILGNFCSVFASPLDFDSVWITAMNRNANGSTGGGQDSRYSENGLQSSSPITTDATANGWDQGRSGYQIVAVPGTQANGKEELMGGFIPLYSNKKDAICHFATKWFKSNGSGTQFKWAGLNAENMGSGEANWGNLVFSRTDPNRMAIGAFDEGVFESTDAGRSFVEARRGNGGDGGNNGAQSGGYSTEDDNRLIFTFGDYTEHTTPVLRTGGNGTWSTNSIFINDKTAVQKGDEIVYMPRYTFASYSPCLHTSSNLAGRKIATNHFVSTNNGSNWTDVRNRPGWPGGGYNAQICLMSWTNADTIYAVNGTGSVISRSTNFGQAWGTASGGGGQVSTGVNLGGVMAKAIWINPFDGDEVMWWRQGTGLVRYNFRTQSQTVEFVSVRNQGMDRIVFDPSNSANEVIYVWNRNNGGEQIWRSVDGSVENITGDLPRQDSARSIVCCPHTGILFSLGTKGTQYFAPPVINALCAERLELYAALFGNPRALVS